MHSEVNRIRVLRIRRQAPTIFASTTGASASSLNSIVTAASSLPSISSNPSATVGPTTETEPTLAPPSDTLVLASTSAASSSLDALADTTTNTATSQSLSQSSDTVATSSPGSTTAELASSSSSGVTEPLSSAFSPSTSSSVDTSAPSSAPTSESSPTGTTTNNTTSPTTTPDSTSPTSQSPSTTTDTTTSSSSRVTTTPPTTTPTSSSSIPTVTSSATTSSTTTTSVTPTSTTSNVSSSPSPSSSATPTTTSSDDSNTTSSATLTSTNSNAITTITSSIVTTIGGQATTLITAIPTSLNTAPANSSSSHTGAIAGSAIGGTLFVLLAILGLFLYRRRRTQRKISLAHRALPAPRSALLAGEDNFDLTGHSSRPSMSETPPRLLLPRGQETGSIFHEGVWPPPGASSRLEDPLLASSNVDLTSIVDEVMGQHDRSSSGGSIPSMAPLLASTTPPREGRAYSPSAFASSASQPAHRTRYGDAFGPSETTPLNTYGHEHQSSIDSTPDTTRPDSTMFPLPPGAAPPSPPGKRDFPDGASTTRSGTLPSHARASTLGSLVVVNNTPEAEEDNPLVDVGPSRAEPPNEIPPLYHMIRRDTNDTFNPPAPDEQNVVDYSPSRDSNSGFAPGLSPKAL